MTAQIIFPQVSMYWIITDGNSYFDGCTNPGSVTTVGAGMQIFWIGPDHTDYVNKCFEIGLVPRNASDVPVIEVNNLDLVTNLNDQITSLNSKIESMETVISGTRISARQARLWLIQNGVDLNIINSVIDSIEDPILRESIKTEWEYAPYIERTYTWINL